MNILTMAVRNLGRNTKRTLLACLSVALSMVAIVALDGLMGGFLDSIVRNYTKSETGHFNVTTERYRVRERFMPVSAAMPDSGAVVETLRAMPELKDQIAVVAERIRFGVVLASGSTAKAAFCVAGDPATERSLLMLDRSLLKDGKSKYCDEPGTVILGQKLAKDLGLGVGDMLKVVTQKADFGLGFKKLRISGLFASGVSTLDGALFQMPLADARELLGLPKGASQVLVMLRDYRGADKAAAAAGSALAAAGLSGLSAASWTGMGDAAQLVQMAGSVYYFMYLFVAFLGAFIIANIMLMITLERRREIGILKSMGMPRKRILYLFLSEGTLLGLLGSAIGISLGIAINALIAVKGFDMTSALAGFSFPMENVVYPRTDVFRTLIILAIGIAVSAALSYLPARAAARTEAVDAIRSA